MEGQETLADRVLALKSSSPCFSCGFGSLSRLPSPSDPLGVLACPQCGAEVASEEAPAATEPRSALLVKAA